MQPTTQQNQSNVGMSVRIPLSLKEKIRQKAGHSSRKISEYVREALREKLARDTPP